MAKAPRGNTQKGVNQAVFEFLEDFFDSKRSFILSDAPSGNGELSLFLHSQFPNARFSLCDAFAAGPQGTDARSISFQKADIHQYYRSQPSGTFDAILCISGVMCFDGIENLIHEIHRSLKPGELLIITNDNIMTVRDRINFMFLGSFKRFKLLSSLNEGNWNVILPQALRMLFKRYGFHGVQVRYTSFYFEDIVWLPLALLIYPLFRAASLISGGDWNFKELKAFFPFRSLICRHYVIVGIKKS